MDLLHSLRQLRIALDSPMLPLASGFLKFLAAVYTCFDATPGVRRRTRHSAARRPAPCSRRSVPAAPASCCHRCSAGRRHSADFDRRDVRKAILTALRRGPLLRSSRRQQSRQRPAHMQLGDTSQCVRSVSLKWTINSALLLARSSYTRDAPE